MVTLWANDGQRIGLLDRIDAKYRPVWDRYSAKDQVALSRYFLPHRSSKAVIGPTRPRMIKWYCPFACQRSFPSGHRYCINVYTGCSHRCVYCYATGYQPQHCAAKRDFRKLLNKDLADLETFEVPPAPLHLSNSTDAFQLLERTQQDAKYALERILAHRQRFTTITILTKNPIQLTEPGYLKILKAICVASTHHSQQNQFATPDHHGLVVEVSLAFWREEAARFYDPGAPSIQQRIDGLRVLSEAGIPLVFRIDPLFPRSPLPDRSGSLLADYGLIEVQTLEDLTQLAKLGKQLCVQHIVFSVGKIVRPRYGDLPAPMKSMLGVYRACSAPSQLAFKSGSYRFPDQLASEHIVRPFLRICEEMQVAAKYCKQNLVETL